MLSWRDTKLFFLAWAISFSTGGAYAAALLAEPTTLLELPWTAVVGAIGLAMAGGLVSTLAALHQAADAGKAMNVRLRLSVDLGMAIVIGFIVYAVVSFMQFGPYALLGGLPFFGFMGARILDPLILVAVQRLEQFASVFGVKRDPPP